MYSVSDTISYRHPDDLHERADNWLLHGRFDPFGKDAWLVEDVQKHGVLLPILVDLNGTISDGNRRRRAAAMVGRSLVPTMVIRDGEQSELFLSAQLGRNLSLFAKCSLYRVRITAVSDALRAQRTAAANEADIDERFQEEAICIEQALNVRWRTLVRGVAVLGAIEELQREGKQTKAGKVRDVFSNFGLRPAIRVLEEKDNVATETPDCGEWSSEGLGKPRLLWQDKAERSLGRLRSTLESNGGLTPTAEKALKSLQRLIARRK